MTEAEEMAERVAVRARADRLADLLETWASDLAAQAKKLRDDFGEVADGLQE